VVRPIKSRQIPNLQEAIKEVAWKQIGESGASSLSLRSIARELKISAPAIYNYFADRDALVTALIVDAFCSFGDYQLQAMAGFPEPGDSVRRLWAIGVAYREWALAYPQRYVLIFGNPIPGYTFPQEQALPVMERSRSALTGIIGEIYAAGMLKVPESLHSLPGSDRVPAYMVNCNGSEESLVPLIAMLIWSRVHGLVSLELGGMIPDVDNLATMLYQLELDLVVSQFVNMQHMGEGHV
jgi:AcrR family transcriptional regulator